MTIHLDDRDPALIIYNYLYGVERSSLDGSFRVDRSRLDVQRERRDLVVLTIDMEEREREI